MVENTYNISFTAGAAMLNETHTVAEVYWETGKDWPLTQEKVLCDNLMGKNKVSTNKRFLSLLKQRLTTLNDEELNLLVNGSVAVRRMVVLLAICKAHSFVFDYITEQVRSVFYNMQERVSYASFNEFFNEKKYEHPELEQITDLTVAKMRQVVFRIMEQTELIESAEDGVIRRPYLTEQLEQMIVKDDAKWLNAFLYSDNEINNLRNLYA